MLSTFAKSEEARQDLTMVGAIPFTDWLGVRLTCFLKMILKLSLRALHPGLTLVIKVVTQAVSARLFLPGAATRLTSQPHIPVQPNVNQNGGSRLSFERRVSKFLLNPIRF